MVREESAADEVKPRPVSRSLSHAKSSFDEVFRRARESWFDGDYDATLKTLDEATPQSKSDVADAALLRARAEYRAKRYAASLEAAQSAGPILDGERHATALMLQGAALIRLDELDVAETILGKAERIPDVHRTITAEILHQQAFLAWFRRDLVGSRALAVKAIGKADDIVLARAQELFGFINASEEKYPEAARSYREALTTLATAKHRDRLLHLNLLNATTSLAVERLDVDALDQTRSEFAKIRWTDDLLEGRFHAYDLAGWLALIAGRPEDAWSDFASAQASVPPDSPYRVSVFTNFAALHRTTNETFAARQNIARASEIARATDWSETHADHRVEFFLWAAEAARLGLPARVDELKRFDALAQGTGNHAYDRGDRRFQAYRLVAYGLTLGAGSKRRAQKMLDEALGIWTSIGYRFRATTTALDLYGLTNDPTYLEFAQRETVGLRAGYLAQSIRSDRRREERGVKDLSRAERRVLAHILEGKTLVQIAAETGRALSTIKIQNGSIFDILKVSNRGQLFVVCAELGVTPESLAEE